MKIVIDDKIPFIKGLLEPFGEVLYLNGSEIRRKDLLNTDALIIRTRTQCNRELLEGTDVRFIATATIGTDHIDTLWCDSANIKWVNAPGCNSGSVMQYISAVIFRLAEKHCFDLSEKTIGVIGVGNVGKKVAEMARSIGMKVLLNDPPREIAGDGSNFSSLSEILSESDILTLHVPLTLSGEHSTIHLADGSFFSQIKQGSFFINSSRGQVCDETSLKKYFVSGKVAGFVLDVWETEPSPDPFLLEYAEIATPHIAGYSLDGKLNATVMVAEAFCHFFNKRIDMPASYILPPPSFSEIDLDILGSGYQIALNEVIKRTYLIESDSEALKKNPSEFENLRGNYWPRREFGAYSLKGNNIIKDTLLKIGFKA